MPIRIGRSDWPSAVTPLPPGAATVAGRYVLVRELGTGDVGAVYLACNPAT